MKIKVNYLIIAIFSMFLATFGVSASTYTPTTNSFENTYSNNLIDMAMSQTDNFINKKYVFFQVDNNYYLVVGDCSVSGNTLSFTNSTVYSAVRTSTGGYNSYYDYSKTTESTTYIYSNYTVLSNIDFPKSVSSQRVSEYYTNSYLIKIMIFVIGLLFALFLTKGRRYL